MIGYLPITFASAIISFILFRSLYKRGAKTRIRAALVLTAFVLAVPAMLFVSNYLLHAQSRRWFIEFHSLPGIEASSGLVGALLGVVFASIRLRSRILNALILIISTAIAAIFAITPFYKQAFCKLDYSELKDRWANGICLQTSSTTCMPASCATVVKILGGSVTEGELAREAGTNRRGTEIWYMRRVMRRHGYKIEVRETESLKDAPTPSILGVKVGSAGHVVVLISKTAAGPEIGDPLGLRKRYSWNEFERVYQPERIYFVVKPMADRM